MKKSSYFISIYIKSIYVILNVFFVTYIHSKNCDLNANTEDVCLITDSVFEKYLLYDVNPSEGFNLRRDVYMRLAVFIKNLQDEIKWHLVLPPWSNLPHWRSTDIGSQSKLPWSLFFDVQSLKSFAPVLEMYEFLEDHGKEAIDHVLILQHFKELSFGNFTWEDKWSIDECQRSVNLIPKNTKTYKWSVLGFNNVSVKNIQCVSFHGSASLLQNLLNNFSGRFFFLENAEVVLHDFYGGEDYWNCRRSMQFNEKLRSIALNFMHSQLNSNFSVAMTSSKNKYSVGNSYLCAHLRRKDFVLSRPKDVPSLNWAAVQIQEKLLKFNLSTVFLISDDMNEGLADVFQDLLPSFNVITFHPSYEIKHKYKDGGIAIIEQIICSYAQYFIGTYESTFSFRIQEERELLNMHPDTTFNRFCGDNQLSCKQPTRWLKNRYFV